MTEEFRFSEPHIVLNLCGTEFSVTVGERTAEICSRILAEARLRLKKLKSGIFSEEVSEDAICKFLKAGIERLVGEGSVDIVFGERPQELLDMAELMCYILSKIKAAYLNNAELLK